MVCHSHEWSCVCWSWWAGSEKEGTTGLQSDFLVTLQREVTPQVVAARRMALNFIFSSCRGSTEESVHNKFGIGEDAFHFSFLGC